MQYTGLKDKNGKEIYEGDIVRYKDIDKMAGTTHDFKEVYFDTELLCFELRYTHNKLLNKQFEKDFEIIGNIHENPELMEDINKLQEVRV